MRRVVEEVVNVSNRRHIVFDVTIRRPFADSDDHDGSTTRRWSFKRLKAVACVTDWSNAEGVLLEQESGGNKFRETLTQICDVSMPRVGRHKRGAMHWWSTEIAELRKVCLRSRHQYTRTRRRRRRAPEEEMARLYREYRATIKALRRAVTSAKFRSWIELLQ
ncbi:uncharacterized protein [Battus philenor]|uniref:uncharacterized protein n=1 Tax=Battus philenor TaxID=42288 RepID=UPI0035D0CDEF